MGLFDWFKRAPAPTRPQSVAVPHPTGGRSFACSSCYTTRGPEEAHVIPWWNEGAAAIFTTFRCNNCWLPSLNETRAWTATMTEAGRAEFIAFLNLHEMTSEAAALQNATVAGAREFILRLLDEVEQGQLIFSSFGGGYRVAG